MSFLDVAYKATQKRLPESTSLQYFALSTQANDADKKALRTLAAHSIASPNNSLLAAVDDVIEINSISSAKNFFKTLI